MMYETYRALILGQYLAALRTVDHCIDRCPDGLWNENVGNHTFCNVVFHTLFFSDYYLGSNEDSLRGQPFHQEHGNIFKGYEQLEDRKPVTLYERAFIKQYLGHVRGKADDVFGSETVEILQGPSGFERRDFTRAELHVYSMRHIQHHAAQLSLRLRIDAGVDIPWVGSGWRVL